MAGVEDEAISTLCLLRGRHWLVKWFFTMSRQAFPGATTLERMAKLLSDYRLPKNVHGFKCWYCDARLIEDGAKLAFIGVNPAGDQHAAAHDKKERYLDAPYEKRDPLWNAWLDEEWPDGDPYHPYQERVHRFFKEMCGPGWEQILRSTACFNVCPFRTVQPGHLPSFLWSSSTEWFGKALIPVAPELIVCDGNGPSRSPWAVLKRRYGMEIVRDRKVHPNEKGSLHVKEGRLKKAPFAGARVLGVPSLSRRHASLWENEELLSLIRDIGSQSPFLRL